MVLDKRKEKVIADIINWKIEYEDFKITEEELKKFIKKLENLNFIQLKDYWFATVGNWLLSRDKFNSEEEIKEQFDKIIKDEQDYGYCW